MIKMKRNFVHRITSTLHRNESSAKIRSWLNINRNVSSQSSATFPQWTARIAGDFERAGLYLRHTRWNVGAGHMTIRLRVPKQEDA
jgi:hypothetical protein